jgi:autotransporter-associated beta strand protein
LPTRTRWAARVAQFWRERSVRTLVLTLLAVGFGVNQLAAATWSGLGTDNNFTTPANWDLGPVPGDSLFFTTINRLTATNDFPIDTAFTDLTIGPGAGAFTLNGNRIILQGSITNNQATSAETIGLDLNPVATPIVDVVSDGSLTISGAIAGPAGLIKTGPGLLTLGGTNTFTGDTLVSVGTLALIGGGSISDSAQIAIASGAILDSSGRTDGTLTLVSGQTLTGDGSIFGRLTSSPGATIAPCCLDTNGEHGVLTVTSDLTLGGDALMEINRTNIRSSTLVTGITTMTYGGILTVTNRGPGLQAGDSFRLYTATNYIGFFASISLPPLDECLIWDISKLEVNGTVSVAALSPLVIHTQPASVTTTACAIATFTVDASESGVFSYVWCANGIPIPNANESSYTKFLVTSADDGTVFTVKITNQCGSVTSDPAVLTVGADSAPPILVSVSATCGSSQVTVTFSERLDAVSATNALNFQISGGLAIQNAILAADEQTVSLITDPLTDSVPRTLTVNGVQDLCGNAIAVNSQILFSCSFPKVFINEWLAGNTNGIVDPIDGQHDDWFEVYNPGPDLVDLAGYFFTDSLANQFKFQVPAGYTVPPGGFLLVWADNQPQQNTITSADLHVNFTLPGNGGEIGLFAPGGAAVDTITFGPQTDDVSEGRWPDGEADRYLLGQTTPRAPNGPPLGISEPCSSKGTEFWLAFPDCAGGANQSLSIAGCTGTSGDVDIPGLAFHQHFTISGTATTTILLPNAVMLIPPDQVLARGVHITVAAGNRPVSVYGFSDVSYVNGPSDGYLGLPVTELGTDYVVLAWGGNNQNDASAFSVVASQDNTKVTITPSITVNTYSRIANQPYNVFLPFAGDTYTLETDDVPTGGPWHGDLTGTRVTADKPVAVFGGAELGRVPDSSIGLNNQWNHLVEQIPPTAAWGREFYTQPLATRANGDTIRILASVNGTVVTVNGTPVALLNAGKFHERIVKGCAHIQANHPVLVAQYANTRSYDFLLNNHNLNVNSSMMLVPAVKQFVRSYSLTTPSAGFANYLNLIVPTADVNQIYDNGSLLSANFTQVGTHPYWCAQVAIDPGQHCLTTTGPLPFGVQVYGWRFIGAYSYPADLCLLPNRPPIVSCPASLTACTGGTLLIPAQVSDADGDSLLVLWQVTPGGTPSLAFSTFPGNTAVQNLTLGQFFAPGTYTVTITVSDGISPPVTCTTIVTVGDTQPPTCITTPGPSFSENFNSGWPAGMSHYGNAIVQNGALKLTRNVNNQRGVAVFSVPPLIRSFRATFKLYIGDGSPGSADGFSFNLADDVPTTFPYGNYEEGIGNGLTVSFDTFSNGSSDPTGIFLKDGGAPSGIGSGPLVALPGWKDVEITMDTCGNVKVFYDGGQYAQAQAINYVPGPNARFALGARTGPLNNNHWVDDLVITTATGPPDITVNAPPNQCCKVVNYSLPSFTDNCDPHPTVVCVPPSGHCFPAGVNRVCCTATDASGNSGYCGFNVVVKDVTPPVINCSQIPVLNGSGCVGFVPDYRGYVTATDNCPLPGPTHIIQVPAPGTAVVAGPTTVTLTVCDAAGNCDSCTTTFTVIAPAKPIPGVFATGVDNNGNVLTVAGTSDPHYNGTVGLSGSAFTPVVINPAPNPWVPNGSDLWIGPTASGFNATAPLYVYRLNFYLPPDCETEVVMGGQWAAVSSITSPATMWLNGAQTAFSCTSVSALSSFALTSGFIGGVNTLEFRVSSLLEMNGLRVRFEGASSRCCECGLEPPAGLVLWLPFDEPNTTVVAHNIAGGNNGAYVGPPTVNPSYEYVDRSLCFNGVNQKVRVPYYSAIDISSGDFSIDAWVKRDANDGGIRQIVNHFGPLSPRGYALYLVNGALTLDMQAAGGSLLTSTGPTVPLDGNWHFVAATVKRNDLFGGLLFVDNATSPAFNTIPANGSLANGSSVTIGAQNSLAGSVESFNGCIDEVEIFNRQLSQPDIIGISSSMQQGKCKISSTLPNVGFCPGDSFVTVQAMICNRSAIPQTFTFGLAGLLPNCGTLPPASLIFSTVPTSPVFIPAWQCVSVSVTVPRPLGLLWPQWGCIEILVQANSSGKMTMRQATAYDKHWVNCLVHLAGSSKLVLTETDGVNRGAFSFGPVTLANPFGTDVVLNYRLNVEGPDMQDDTRVISLNGLPPGTPIINSVALAPEESLTIDINGQFLTDDPNQNYTIWIEGHVDNSGIYAPVADFVVSEFFQANMEIILLRVGDTQQPAVSWSGFGTLQCAPALDGPWTDLPDAENPYVIPIGVGNARFYQLRQ